MMHPTTEPAKALTRDEYNHLADQTGRPLLDPPIGGGPASVTRRANNAAYSRIFDQQEQEHENRTGVPDDSFWAPRRPNRKPEKPCGTDAAFYRHKRRKEEPCGACREAHNAEKVLQRQRKKGRL